jgi:ribosomal protein S18 acetylase RimI-like enzyme
MTAYRFCRSDDLGLLAEAHGHCRGPEEDPGSPNTPALDRARLKELVREIDLWSSSSMVALEGSEPVGVLLGCKRDTATLVHALRVHPGHRRRGHARHLLTSLSSKLAILGPPRLVAEVPADRPAALALFEACGWRREESLADWYRATAMPDELSSIGGAESSVATISVEEALASGLLAPTAAGWRRDPTSFERQADRLTCHAFYSADRLEAAVVSRALHARRGDVEILAFGATAGEVGRLGLRLLLSELGRSADGARLVVPGVSPAEEVATPLFELFFLRGAEQVRFATEAKSA